MRVRAFVAAFAVVALVGGGSALAAPAALTGAVKAPLTLDEATLKALPAVKLTVAFETAKGKETGTYTGALIWDLIGKAGLVNADGHNPELRHTLLITGSDGYQAAVAEGEFDPKFENKQVLLAYEGTDSKASFDHLRLIVPGDVHGGRAVSDVVSIEVK